MTRLISLVALFALWQIAAHFANPRLLPGPMAVLTDDEVRGRVGRAVCSARRHARPRRGGVPARDGDWIGDWLRDGTERAHLIARPTHGSSCS